MSTQQAPAGTAPYVMGVDIGSTTSKCVILDSTGNILADVIIAVGTGTSGPERALTEALDSAGLTREDISCLIATGYGRNTFPGADRQKSELSCHAKGAGKLFPEARTVIDIGGQDAKVLQLGTNGTLLNFTMNDKCAAGTGRFLDVMANVLEMGIQDLAPEGAKSTHPAHISSTCTVFAESEVISQLASGTPKADIIAGIHDSVAKRVAGLAKRTGITPQVVMTGGVAQNYGVVRSIEKLIEQPITTTPFAQSVGAYGAALYALEQVQNG